MDVSRKSHQTAIQFLKTSWRERSVRQQFWLKMLLMLIALMIGLPFSKGGPIVSIEAVLLLSAVVVAGSLLLWAMSMRCPRCRYRVTEHWGGFVVPWVPRKCRKCGMPFDRPVG